MTPAQKRYSSGVKSIIDTRPGLSPVGTIL